MSFTPFLVFLGLTSFSSFLLLHFSSFNVIVPSNNNKQIISYAATTSRTIPNIAGSVGEDCDHFWLDITWPFGFCSRNPKKDCARVETLPKQFGIHGLWPVNGSGSTLNGSESNANIENLLRNHKLLLEMMRVDWPNFKTYKDNQTYYWYWKHEWDEHGNACGKAFNDSPINYFNTTVNIYRKLNLMGHLKKKSITPNASKMYDQEKFRAAIKSSNGNKDVILTCNGASRQILESVTLCVHRDANTFIPCNRSKEITRNKSCNKKTIKFLSEVIK